MNRQLFDRMAQSLRHRVQMMVARAVVTRIDDARGIQAVQASVLDGEIVEAAERMQDYGFSSVPFPDAEAVIVFPGGLRSHGLVVAVGDRRYRLKGLEAGEVAMHDDQGQQIVLKRDGIRIVSPLKIEIETPELKVTAETTVTVICPEINLGGEGGKLVARHDDPVVAGKVVATSTRVKAL